MPTFRTTKFRHVRSPLQEEVIYDIDDPAIWSSYKAERVQLSQEEVDAMVERAKNNMKLGTEYVPCAIQGDSMRYFHLI